MRGYSCTPIVQYGRGTRGGEGPECKQKHQNQKNDRSLWTGILECCSGVPCASHTCDTVGGSQYGHAPLMQCTANTLALDPPRDRAAAGLHLVARLIAPGPPTFLRPMCETRVLRILLTRAHSRGRARPPQRPWPRHGNASRDDTHPASRSPSAGALGRSCAATRPCCCARRGIGRRSAARSGASGARSCGR